MVGIGDWLVIIGNRHRAGGGDAGSNQAGRREDCKWKDSEEAHRFWQAGRGGLGLRLSVKELSQKSGLADCCRHINLAHMKTVAKFNARVLRDGKWFVAFSPEFPEGNGQGLTEAEALQSLRESILLLLEDRLEDAQASLGCGEKLVPLALT
jgi:predicted RNase H-like HicB family nuclease